MNDLMKTGIVPPEYYVVEVECKCRKCGVKFGYRKCIDDSLVKFIDSSGLEEAWMPTYGDGGYLNLLETLVPGFDSHHQAITVPISRRFEIAFSEFQSPPTSGGRWSIGVRPICPQCGTTNVKQLTETVLYNPELAWAKYRPPKDT